MPLRAVLGSVRMHARRFPRGTWLTEQQVAVSQLLEHSVVATGEQWTAVCALGWIGCSNGRPAVSSTN
jgi:hypothetical protein